jgi:tetratricopeptide (TPR) repeat protein
MEMMKRKISLFIIILAILVSGANAQTAAQRACETKRRQLETMKADCEKMGRNAPGYAKCAADFRKELAGYNTGCRSAGATTGGKNDAGLESQIDAFKAVEKDCETKGFENSRCAVAIRNLGSLYYQIESQEQITCEDDYQVKRQQWEDRDKKGPEPDRCKREYDQSLEYFNKFMKLYPNDRAYASVLMQVSFIYMTQIQDDKAFALWKHLVESDPKNQLAGSAWLRIGEYHYNARRNRDAIHAYKKALEMRETLRNSKELALLIYHMAESYNNMGEFLEAAKWFFEYVTGSDKGEYPPDLRTEAMSFMAGAFADMDNGIDVARKFMDSHKGITFRDTLFFEIGMKNLTRDRLDEAAYSFKRLLEINPVYVDAPIAHVRLINILDEKKQFEEAQKSRIEVVKLYDDNSRWYQTHRNNQEAIKEARNVIRGAYFQIPAYHHRKADELEQAGDLERSKSEYQSALRSYDEFLKAYAQPHWDHYQVNTFKSIVYGALKDYKRQADMLNWIADVDTLPFGRQPQGYPQLLKKNEAAYNAVLAMDNYRLQGLESVGGDKKAAYQLPQTKAYLAQVDKYLKGYGSDPANSEAAELAFNAAIVHYDAEEYRTSVDVLRHLKKVYPKHKYEKEIRGNLARSLTQAGMLDDAEKEYEELLPLYAKSDTNYVAIERSIAAVQFQKAEQLMQAKQYIPAAQAYLALQRRFPMMTFSDKALFEAGIAYENANELDKSAETFLRIHTTYRDSELAIRGILRAAGVFKKKKDAKKAAETFLIVTNTYPADSMAFQAVGFAATTYDSIPDKKKAAETYMIADVKFSTNPQTPAFVYNACLTYEEAKMVDEAIRCNTLITTKYSKSSYAVDAGFSIPKAYEKSGKWKEATEGYLAFIRQFGNADAGKLIAAYFGAAKAFDKLNDEKSALANFQLTLDAFDKYGAQINADPGAPAEAAYRLGLSEKSKMDAVEIKGNARAKQKTIQDLTGLLGKATQYFVKSATYNHEQWTFKATNEMGYLFVMMAEKVRNQEVAGSLDEQFAERIGIVQGLPSFYEKGREFFQKNIDVAREQGYYNADVVTAENGYIEMFYRDGRTFAELGEAFRKAPVPDISRVPEDDIIYELYDLGFEDEEISESGNPRKLWSDHYRNTLNEKAEMAEQGGTPRYENCIRAAQFYQIKNEWVDKCRASLNEVDSGSEVLTLAWDKYDASNLFRDKHYFTNKTRIEQIFGNEVMSNNEKISVFKTMLEEAKSRQVNLLKELEELRLRLNPPTVSPAL